MQAEVDRNIKSYDIESSKWTPAQRRQHEVYAVGAGAFVSYSSKLDSYHGNYWLDFSNNNYHAWTPMIHVLGQWIQVSDLTPKVWTSIILQGRGDHPWWVTSYKVMYTVDGRDWQYVEHGRVFPGSSGKSSKVRVNFRKPVYARTLRIYPQTWHGGICLRFDAIYMDVACKS